MKIVLLQSSLVWGDIDRNLKNFDRKLTEIQDAALILLPEMFPVGCMMVKREAEMVKAQREKMAVRYEEVQQKMQEWARKSGALVMGSTVYREGKNYYNRLLAALPDGETKYYDKRHCFRIGGENEYYTPGQKRQVFEFRGMKIAAFICYDLRFPVWSRNVEGYDLAVYVANWPASRREVWQTLLRARAMENQCYVAGVNCVGTDDSGLGYAGDSMVVDARGQVMAQGKEGQEELVQAEVCMEQLRDFRKRFPVLEDKDAFNLK